MSTTWTALAADGGTVASPEAVALDAQGRVLRGAAAVDRARACARWPRTVAVRVQRADEDLAALLDEQRGDGWTCDADAHHVARLAEQGITLRGVSACEDLVHLARYRREYGLTPQPGDRLVELVGRVEDTDADRHALRAVDVEAAVVVGDAAEWGAAIDSAAEVEDALDDVGPESDGYTYASEDEVWQEYAPTAERQRWIRWAIGAGGR